MTFQKKLAVLCLTALAFLVCVSCGAGSGQEVIDLIRADDVAEVEFQKTLEDGEHTKECASFTLEPAEIEQFYEALSAAKVKDIDTQSFSISSDIRYYIFLNNDDGVPVGALKFYAADTLIFDFAHGDQPAAHRRYSIQSSSLTDCFEAIIAAHSTTTP